MDKRGHPGTAVLTRDIIPVNVPIEVNKTNEIFRLWNNRTTISSGVSCRRRMQVLVKQADRSSVSLSSALDTKVQCVVTLSPVIPSAVASDKSSL